jgi:hypothetical protein
VLPLNQFRRGCIFSALIVCAALLAFAFQAQARVRRIVIDKAKSATPAFNGKSFGKVGPYERIVGHAYGELDPNDSHNAIIQDIQLAPRNNRGMVEYVATFTLTKPIDISKGSNLLIYEVPNRGRKVEVEGSEDGDTYLSSGWQGDIPDAKSLDLNAPETLVVPIAKNPDGSAITGPVLARIKNTRGSTAKLIVYSRPIPYLPASLDTRQAILTSRTSESTDGSSSPQITIPSSDWAWADCTQMPFPGTPDPSKVCLKKGFDPALLYQLVFSAKDPLVLGVGFAATRDIVSFFRNADKDDDGTPNPIAKKISLAIGQGSSQSGNFIRSFIHLGFNQDESGKIVWDGAMPHIAGRQIALNIRFALPDGAADPYEPGSDGLVWWSDWADTKRGRKTGGLLDRCTATRSCPKIFETFGATEFWALRMSPDLVGTSAAEDIPLPDNVRRYYFPGTTHGGGSGGFDPAPPPPARGRAGTCVLPANPNPEFYAMEALLVAMKDWLQKGTPPPPSQYPRLIDGSLVPPTKSAMGFPTIPGLAFKDSFENPLLDYEWGPNFVYNDFSGVISKEPPAIKQVVPLLVPKVNSDGNEIAGVPSVLHQAPLGTYLGWNITAEGFFKGQFCAFTGGYIPFARTKAERIASQDPRLSLEERYGNKEGYVAAVRKAAEKAVRDRFLLPEDAEQLIQQATTTDIFAR